MILASNFNTFLTDISIVILAIILIGLLLKYLKQPYIIGYILVGVFLGDSGIGLIQNSDMIQNIGEVGLVLLLFFVGMEIDLPEFKKQWKISLLGTLLQVVLCVGLLAALGYFLDWTLQRIIVLGFVVALSSSAVIIKVLQDKGLFNSKLGRNVISILLTQDILIAPMLIVISLLGGESQSVSSILLLVAGAFIFLLILFYIYSKKEIQMPFSETIIQDHELQVFGALIFCFGGALLSSFFGLSPALGSFVGGMIIHAAKSTEWIHDTLNSFRILFVSVFFIGVGLQINLDFIEQNIGPILLALAGVFIMNHLINTIILRLFSRTWKEAVLGGAFLAQIGELSFLLSLAAYNLGIITDFGQLFTISLIAITLIISPFWIAMTEYILGRR